MIIYVAGPMAGIENYHENFAQAQKYLESEGHVVLNPAFLPFGMTNSDYAAICTSMLSRADVIYLLHGWEGHVGCESEKAYAEWTLKWVWYEDTDYDFQEWRKHDDGV